MLDIKDNPFLKKYLEKKSNLMIVSKDILQKVQNWEKQKLSNLELIKDEEMEEI